MAKIDDLVSIVGAMKVDLTGQGKSTNSSEKPRIFFHPCRSDVHFITVATDSIGHKFYGGVWSDAESVLGAKFSKGGKPIVILSSKSLHGRSNIVFALPPGTGVVITRSVVEYVITEYGTAYISCKPIRERCKWY